MVSIRIRQPHGGSRAPHSRFCCSSSICSTVCPGMRIFRNERPIQGPGELTRSHHECRDRCDDRRADSVRSRSAAAATLAAGGNDRVDRRRKSEPAGSSRLPRRKPAWNNGIAAHVNSVGNQVDAVLRCSARGDDPSGSWIGADIGCNCDQHDEQVETKRKGGPEFPEAQFPVAR